MAVIPLTLTISLCLVATFVLFFLRESAHRAFSSAEHDAMLPLSDETPSLPSSRSSPATTPARALSHGLSRGRRCGCSADSEGHDDHDHDHDHGHATGSASGSGRAPCEGCLRRAEERSRRAAAPAETVTAGS